MYEMSDKEFAEYMKKQIEEINVYKWIESEAVGYNLGTVAIKDWLELYAEKFREEWLSGIE